MEGSIMGVNLERQTVLIPRYLGPSSVGAASGGKLSLAPETPWALFKELTWHIVVQGITGSPTSGNLIPSFRIGTTYTDPNVNSGNEGNSTVLSFLDDAQIGNFIVEGEDWAPIPYNTSTSPPYHQQRTIRNFGSKCDLYLDTSTLSGGTTPAFLVTVEMEAKG